VTDLEPHAWEYRVPTEASMFDACPASSDPIGPWILALVLAPQTLITDLLDTRVAAKREATLKQFRAAESGHTTAWYRMSSNKETDKRGSQASMSVEGLCWSPEDPAEVTLAGMLPVAREYFLGLHTLEPPMTRCALAQQVLLRKVAAMYSGMPCPEHWTGRITLEEVAALTPRMHNTAPGPDSIHNSFWKELQRCLAMMDPPAPDLWEVFRELTDDLRVHGTSQGCFKDANLSLFYKKGHPMLVANYRPISSMNTDCKMYTNIVNMRLAPWVVALLHEDQKGFVLGRQITKHTRLAAEVSHLANRTRTDRYIVSLDQAKAYD